MNISDFLTPEERELARLLGRPSATLAPGARIDAAIAEMARQPLATPASPPLSSAPASALRPRHGRHRRMMPALAMAASLVLVVGLAWQLRPNLPPMEAHEVASDVAPMAEAPPLPAAMPLPAPPLVAETASAPANPAARMANPAQPNRGAAPPASRTSVPATDMPAEPATHTASPPQQITVTGSRVAKAAAANVGQQRAREVAPPAPPAPPAPAMAAPSPPPQTAIVLPAPANAERAQLAAAPAAFAGDIAPPDIEADTALPARQWLQRIRQRHKEGDAAGARASLLRFIETHPKTRIPRDLRPLLKE